MHLHSGGVYGMICEIMLKFNDLKFTLSSVCHLWTLFNKP